MNEPPVVYPLLSEVEEMLKKKFSKETVASRLPSSADDAAASARIDELVLDDELRGKMPFTKDKYLVKENPQLVQWERETRKFLRRLSPIHGHRVSAVMVYEWATGIRVKELMEAGGNANGDLRKLNKILRLYFGKSYMSYIAGRKVPHCFKVPQGYYIRSHRPHSLTLYSEYCEKTLNP